MSAPPAADASVLAPPVPTRSPVTLRSAAPYLLVAVVVLVSELVASLLSSEALADDPDSLGSRLSLGPVLALAGLATIVVARTSAGALRSVLVTLTTALAALGPLAAALAARALAAENAGEASAYARELVRLHEATWLAGVVLTAVACVGTPLVAVVAAHGRPRPVARPVSRTARQAWTGLALVAAGCAAVLGLVMLIPGGADVLGLWFSDPTVVLAESGIVLVLVVLALCRRASRFDGARVAAAAMLVVATIHVGAAHWRVEHTSGLSLSDVATYLAAGGWMPLAHLDAPGAPLGVAVLMLAAGAAMLLATRPSPRA